MDYLSPLRSELKLKILLSLLEGEKKVSELKTHIDTRDTTILHILEEFNDLDLTTKKQGVYNLTSIGSIEAKIFKEYMATAETMEKFKAFWLNHDISAIPSHLLLNLGFLLQSSIVKTEASELGIVHKTFLENIKQSKEIKGISPIFHTDFISLFGLLLEQGCNIELIMSSNVLEKINKYVDIGSVQKYFAQGSLKIYLNDNAKVALALTESSFSLGLFSLSGLYDDSVDLRSNDSKALTWGALLFEDIARKSKKIS